MIRINPDYEQTLLIPKNTEGEPFVLRIHSELTQKNVVYQVVDEGNSNRYYQIVIDADEVPEGEYNYTLSTEEGAELAVGLLQVGEVENSETIIQYGESIQYIQYYPQRPKTPNISISGATALEFSDTAITYVVKSNMDWAQTIYVKQGAEGEYSTYSATTYFEKGTHQLTLPIPANSGPSQIYYLIAVGIDDGEVAVSANLEVIQDKEYFTVYCQTAESIAASATEISYSVSFNWYNSYRTGTSYLYKDGVLLYETDFGRYPYGFSSYYEIPANTASTPVNYEFKVVMPATPNEPMTSAHSFTTQEAYVAPEQTYLIMSASSYNLAAEDDELSFAWSANTEWVLSTIAPWGEGEGYMAAGSGNPTYMIGVNEESEPRTIIYRGVTTDGQASQTLTFIQAGSGSTPTPIPSGYTAQRFTIEMLEDGDINWDGVGNVYYDINPEVNGYNQGGQVDHSITGLHSGDIIEFYVEEDVTSNPYRNNPITSTARHNVYGNIMSLLYVDYATATTISKIQVFNGLFKGDSGLISAENLVLPATTLDYSCYGSMFYNCTNLVTAPELPATTLYTNCYAYMFQNCTSLTTAPVLPALTLVNSCYYFMFDGCTNLNYVKCLATDISANLCVDKWLKGVSPTGDFWRMSSTNWGSGDSGIPSGWTSHNIDR